MQAIDLALDNLKLPGITIRSISPLDPSGWVRVAVARTGNEPLQINLAADTKPAPAAAHRTAASTQPETPAAGQR
jgi:hypothetical protein